MEIDVDLDGCRLVAPDRESMLSLLQKMLRVSDFGRVVKDGRNTGQNFNYTSYEAFSAMLKQRLLDEKILFSLGTTSIFNERVSKDKVGGGTSVDTLSTSSGTACFWDTETGAVLSVAVSGTGQDFGDKSGFKAITGALKYGTMRNFLANDKEADPDADDAGRLTHKEVSQDKTVSAETAEKEPAGGEPVEFRMNVDALSEEQKALYFGTRKHYDNVKDEEFAMALGFELTEYKGDPKDGFRIIGQYLKKTGRTWHS